ncbi:hypothetical protein LEP1GSC021_5006 [Leptospira noguchii str. 1993005606]|uniref:Uncharacterized protein n=1 Tax=Leptospira noguchii str. 2001034031 TaxID=1193053 RepID=M6Y817_9LEPT|nr:hypothetical protein LEP1GSC024_2239 [Leptospira noguchii str. 2001034031]EPE85030.1 hypothetical protein LEP1GSC021_5006 [Leptospira noguchii str. 1993005606]
MFRAKYIIIFECVWEENEFLFFNCKKRNVSKVTFIAVLFFGGFA